ncbi:glycoside hydrolase domain-containing protein [Fodinicola acaciae]|uniref:glycoside hydrolase domain-containing protein n=1 Tax=Fodinicola acaciae TaxID=2681555 RepID=UPI0013D5C837|nr:glycoside hydrolase domain-containing protein [Fodinicola acaciae]
MRFRQTARGVLCGLALMLTVAVVPGQVFAAPKAGTGLDYWTEPSSTNVFRDTLPTKESGRSIRLDTARNEAESAQVVVRSPVAFTVTGVRFSALSNGSSRIAADQLSYNFITYKTLKGNTPHTYPVTRKAVADFPDALSNSRTIDVPAGDNQPIWLTLTVPKTVPAGVYTGVATVRTTRGDVRVPLTADVRAVTIPDSKDGTFSNSLWNQFNGEISWKPDGSLEPGWLPTIEKFYGYHRFTPQWWNLMDNVATQMKRHRNNVVTLPLVNMLLDGDTTVTDNSDGTGRYSFDWSKIDQVVQFFIDQGVIKELEGFWVSADTDNWGRPADGIREVEIIDGTGGKGHRNYANWDSAKANNFIDQFIPALKAHLDAKGWTESLKYWMHVGDEPVGDKEETAWRGIASRMRSHWPDVRIADAAFHEPTAAQLASTMSFMIPNLLNYSPNPRPYDQIVREQGKRLWFYTCNIPQGNYLNRFIDQPQFDQRMMVWYAYSRGASGYLHYAMAQWATPLEKDDFAGDHYITWPDKANNTIESTVRWESLRDGIEDWETLNILGHTNPGLARDLAASLTQTADKYSPDTGYQARIRRIMLDAAAGKPIPASRVAGATASSGDPTNAIDRNPGTAWRPDSTSAQWLRIDLGRQSQLDGLRLNWGQQKPPAYRVQLSYDATHWTTAQTVTGSDGGDDFVGLNGKAAYVRIDLDAATTPYALTTVDVVGRPLAKTNLLGGKGYAVSPAPAVTPDDTGRESTDGVLADAWDDGRSYGFAPGQNTVTISFDLGRAQSVDELRMHAYEEYPAYRPDQITVATSLDGTTWTQRGRPAVAPNDQARIWYDVDFPSAQARFLRITLQKAYSADADKMFVDEIELYGRR